MSPDICIHHHPCADGFGAAYAIWRRFPACQFVGANYGAPPPDVTGKHVVIVDFSYKNSVLKEMAAKAASLLVIDHHKTAAQDLADLPDARECMVQGDDPWAHWSDTVATRGPGAIAAVFDMHKSGARLTWEFLHPSRRPVPKLLLHVEDRDLWKFALDGTREIQSVVFSHPYDFEVWDDLICACEDPMMRERLRGQGAAIERKHQKDVAELLRLTTRTMVIGGYSVPVANMPYTMASDAANKLAEGMPFAATYYDSQFERRFSLRSRGDGADVSEIAKMYGGGGHRNAAGFARPLGWEGDIV